MTRTKTVIVCTSVSHGNTKRIAEAMSEALSASVVSPAEIEPQQLASYDLVGFGSGIFQMNFHAELRQFVDALPRGNWGNAFVIATSGLPEPRLRPYTRRFGQQLERKGFDVVDTFSCRGYDTWLPFTLVGGIGKGRPDDGDIKAARRFAEGLSRVR